MLCFFFFNDTATTEIYTLSLHDVLPISADELRLVREQEQRCGDDGQPEGHRREPVQRVQGEHRRDHDRRSEEHTSELQSRQYLVCRLLLEKKNNPPTTPTIQLVINSSVT